MSLLPDIGTTHIVTERGRVTTAATQVPAWMPRSWVSHDVVDGLVDGAAMVIRKDGDAVLAGSSRLLPEQCELVSASGDIGRGVAVRGEGFRQSVWQSL